MWVILLFFFQKTGVCTRNTPQVCTSSVIHLLTSRQTEIKIVKYDALFLIIFNEPLCQRTRILDRNSPAKMLTSKLRIGCIA